MQTASAAIRSILTTASRRSSRPLSKRSETARKYGTPNEDYKKILRDESAILSKEELEDIIENELKKNESEMDPDLIEYCIYLINRLESAENKEGADEKILKLEKKEERPDIKQLAYKGRKSIVTAALVAALCAVTVIVSLAVSNGNVKNSAVDFYDNHVRVYLDGNADDDSNEIMFFGSVLDSELEKQGFAEIMLPGEILSDKCEIMNVQYEKQDNLLSAIIPYRLNGTSGIVRIRKYSNKDIMSAIDFRNCNNRVEQIEIHGIPVYIISQDEYCSIAYQKGLTQYVITITSDMDEAIELAKTIE